ncbi:MAG: glycoside hydrolase family 2 protein [Solobacterium sp.]|nr:glycoside hydrolase family 2 protein [Solobacterium sp.]
MMFRINDNWEFVEEFSDAFLRGEGEGIPIRIPHTVKELPLHYADSLAYQMVSGYRRKINITKEMEGKDIFLEFGAVGHEAIVYLNGKEVGSHHNGYTKFRIDITDAVEYGKENLLVVKVDSRESLNIPPFGYVIDYLTYGGIYRDVYLDIKEKKRIEDVYLTTPTLHSIVLDLHYKGDVKDEEVYVRVLDAEGNCVIEEKEKCERKFMYTLKDAHPWSIDDPYLYRCILELGKDQYAFNFGIRTIRVTEKQFYLNDEPIFLRGLNRHQSYPYVGYAVSDSLQREDARILKEELHVNTVRTSHYPQSHAFIEACDRLGLLVFTEIPGWQHIGDEEWKKQAIQNVREMIQEYRQHPSIVIWGVRINESQDDDALYRITNDVAHQMDPTRPTSGVRFLEKSHLFEDIYAYNDFSHNGITPGVKPKRMVMEDTKHPLLISESNGHMYPTKNYDSWEKRQEHALRHARVLNGAMSDKEHIGCIQWCMFDYATHKDFGSGDRICYHGVLDSFRNPKLAASLYASQQDEELVFAFGSTMDIGDYPAGRIDKMYAFTNADEVRLYKNEQFVKTYKESEFKGLLHGPIAIDDRIGELLQSQEGYDNKKAGIIHDALLDAGKYGIDKMPVASKAKLAYAMMHYKMPYSEGVRLFNTYVGGWGEGNTEWKFEVVKDGEVKKTVYRKANTDLHLEVKVSHTTLIESDTYDMSAIRLRLLDGVDVVASYAQYPVNLKVEGPIEIVGPKCITLEGGMGGTYIRTIGEIGVAKLWIEIEGIAKEEVNVKIQRG